MVDWLSGAAGVRQRSRGLLYFAAVLQPGPEPTDKSSDASTTVVSTRLGEEFAHDLSLQL